MTCVFCCFVCRRLSHTVNAATLVACRKCAPAPICHDSFGSKLRLTYGSRFVRDTPAIAYTVPPISESREPPTNDADATWTDGMISIRRRRMSYSSPARAWLPISECGPYQPSQPVQSPAE